ncbi:hypothetical protein PMAYCL1PPCAC_29810 [Pristionchus mayeri]|uniref:Uncharacterized protein n=1 Tax=Pristionchus mayeri TaxID=1317129 RepID=A0AAN5DBM1_9BILA|nr:hypothetical protein PMAYCL1PPCAC_29810 [Pristionchus mayeri]
MGRSGNPVLTEEQKKKISMRGGGQPRRGGGPPGRNFFLQGRGGGGGGRGGGNGPSRGAAPHGRGNFGGPPGFAQARYGFFTNDMPSGPIGHVNKQFVDSRMPVMTPSASSVGGGDRPIRPPNGGLMPPPLRGAGDDTNWVPVGPPRSLLEPLGGLGGGGGGMAPSGSGASRPPANGAIHELFGKMVWKKMEMLEDPSEVDSLQNEIMELIAKAVKKQQERKAKEAVDGGGDGQSETIPYGRPHAANNGEEPAFGNMPKFGGYKPYQGPGFF